MWSSVSYCISAAGLTRCDPFLHGEALFPELRGKVHPLCLLDDTSAERHLTCARRNQYQRPNPGFHVQGWGTEPRCQLPYMSFQVSETEPDLPGICTPGSISNTHLFGTSHPHLHYSLGSCETRRTFSATEAVYQFHPAFATHGGL